METDDWPTLPWAGLDQRCNTMGLMVNIKARTTFSAGEVMMEKWLDL